MEVREERRVVGKVFIYTLDKEGDRQIGTHRICCDYLDNIGQINDDSLEEIIMFYDCFLREIDLREVDTITKKGTTYYAFK